MVTSSGCTAPSGEPWSNGLVIFFLDVLQQPPIILCLFEARRASRAELVMPAGCDPRNHAKVHRMTNDTKQIRPYGAWTSPISADLVATSGVRLGQTLYDNDDLYWLEGRPSEGGRQALVRRNAQKEIADVLPADFNVRTPCP